MNVRLVMFTYGADDFHLLLDENGEITLEKNNVKIVETQTRFSPCWVVTSLTAILLLYKES